MFNNKICELHHLQDALEAALRETELGKQKDIYTSVAIGGLAIIALSGGIALVVVSGGTVIPLLVTGAPAAAHVIAFGAMAGGLSLIGGGALAGSITYKKLKKYYSQYSTVQADQFINEASKLIKDYEGIDLMMHLNPFQLGKIARYLRETQYRKAVEFLSGILERARQAEQEEKDELDPSMHHRTENSAVYQNQSMNLPVNTEEGKKDSIEMTTEPGVSPENRGNK